MKKLSEATSDRLRFYALNNAAKESYNLGHYEEARKYATELRDLGSRFKEDWNYGNAIQDYNIVLGRLALRKGHLEQAKKHLLAAGRNPGSPQMNSFGPNMSLARDLLEKDEKEIVIQYFELCKSFWKMHDGRLDRWQRDVRAGEIPDFGANLLY